MSVLLLRVASLSWCSTRLDEFDEAAMTGSGDFVVCAAALDGASSPTALGFSMRCLLSTDSMALLCGFFVSAPLRVDLETLFLDPEPNARVDCPLFFLGGIIVSGYVLSSLLYA